MNFTRVQKVAVQEVLETEVRSSTPRARTASRDRVAMGSLRSDVQIPAPAFRITSYRCFSYRSEMQRWNLRQRKPCPPPNERRKASTFYNRRHIHRRLRSRVFDCAKI